MNIVAYAALYPKYEPLSDSPPFRKPSSRKNDEWKSQTPGPMVCRQTRKLFCGKNWKYPMLSFGDLANAFAIFLDCLWRERFLLYSPWWPSYNNFLVPICVQFLASVPGAKQMWALKERVRQNCRYFRSDRMLGGLEKVLFEMLEKAAIIWKDDTKAVYSIPPNRKAPPVII